MFSKFLMCQFYFIYTFILSRNSEILIESKLLNMRIWPEDLSFCASYSNPSQNPLNMKSKDRVRKHYFTELSFSFHQRLAVNPHKVPNIEHKIYSRAILIVIGVLIDRSIRQIVCLTANRYSTFPLHLIATWNQTVISSTY